MNSWIICNSIFFKYEDAYPLSIGGFSFISVEDEADLSRLLQSNRVIENYGDSYKRSLLNEEFFFQNLVFDPQDNLVIKLQEERSFLVELFSYLWFVKDNSSNITISTTQSFEHNYVARLLPSQSYIKADLTSSVETFSLADIRFAYEILLKHIPIRSDFSDEDRNLSQNTHKGLSLLSHTTNYNRYNRLERAMLFLHNARISPTLPAKISFYVLILECLFSAGDTTELKHRLGERIALYFGSTSDERNSLYNEFSDYYNIRSKYVHGQPIEGYDGKKMMKLYESSVGADSLVRRILIKIITHDTDKFLLPSKGLRDWFNSMLFK